MAKRQANGATNSLDKKFEIDTDTFVVVTNFNGHLLVHIRKYNGDYPTKEGVCMFSNQYYQLLELLQKKEKGTLNMGQMRIRKNKRCNNGGTTRQRSLHTIEKHGSNQHAIKVNLSLIF